VTAETKSLAASRTQVFLSAWVLYAGYYICRKDINPNSAPGISQLAFSLICFGAAYAISHLSAVSWQTLMGTPDSFDRRWYFDPMHQPSRLPIHARTGIIVLIGNGLGQGLGWPSILRLIGEWFRRGERDRVLSWWSTSYILGGVLATSLTAWLAVHTRVVALTGFHPAYLVSSTVLLLAAVFFYWGTANLARPAADGSLTPITSRSASQAGRTQAAAWSEILNNRRIQVVSSYTSFSR